MGNTIRAEPAGGYTNVIDISYDTQPFPPRPFNPLIFGLCLPPDLVEKMFIAKHTLKHRSGDKAANGDSGSLEKKTVPKLKPTEHNKACHTMSNLAKVKHTPIVEAVPYPSPEAALGFGGVHTADGRALQAAFNLDALKN